MLFLPLLTTLVVVNLCSLLLVNVGHDLGRYFDVDLSIEITFSDGFFWVFFASCDHFL